MLAATLFLGMALSAMAQVATYTDSKTGITFDQYTDTTGYQFGLALPETIGTDLIGQMCFPVVDGAGWAGLDFGSAMTGHLLIVAWPNGDDLVSSFRYASGYVTPPVYDGNMTLSSIKSGTYVNDTAACYTFLCSGCITTDDVSFAASDTEAVFGWALSDTAVTDPTDSTSALTMHNSGEGEFAITFANAQSADYATWAAMATASNTTSSSNSTTSSSGSTSSNSTGTASNTTTTTSNSTYDYIIAGGGTAGLIVAERLAESGASVLVVERGGASTASSGGTTMVSWNSSVTQYDVPAMGYYLTTASDTSEYCTDTASQAGCLLGGSSEVNAMMFVKPQDVDFDDKWPTGWKSAEVADAADRLYERNPGTTLPSADGERYDQGAYDVLSTFFSGNGFSSIDAINDTSRTDVFSHPPISIANGLRAGPVMSYLPLAETYSNFKLQLNTKVIRAIRNTTFVSGIEVENEDSSREIINVTPSTGKVILAAGTLSTPRILMYSGIGPTEQIDIVQSELADSVTLPDESAWIDLPVGVGLKDHPIISVSLSTASTLSSLASTAFTAPNSTDISLFAEGSGLLSQSGQRLNFWTSVVSPSDGLTRYIQGTCNSPSNNTVKIKTYVTHGLTSSTNLTLDSTGGNTVFTDNPWLKTQGDIEAYEVFFDRLLNMTRSGNSSLTVELADGSAAGSNITGSSLYANVKSTLTTGAHYVGTAKMGTDDGRTNGTSVVDTNTKVYGTDNLFVVDGSIHPDLPTGNTQAIIMVAAEQAAAKILALNTTSTAGSSSSSSSGSAASSAVISSSSASPVTSVAAVASSSVPVITGSTFSASATTLATVVASSSSAGVATGTSGSTTTATSSASSGSGSSGSSTGSTSGSTSGSSSMLYLIDLIIELIEDLLTKKSS